MSTLFTTYFPWTSLQFIFNRSRLSCQKVKTQKLCFPEMYIAYWLTIHNPLYCTFYCKSWKLGNNLWLYFVNIISADAAIYFNWQLKWLLHAQLCCWMSYAGSVHHVKKTTSIFLDKKHATIRDFSLIWSICRDKQIYIDIFVAFCSIKAPRKMLNIICKFFKVVKTL